MNTSLLGKFSNAQELLEYFKFDKPPVNVRKICRNLGISIAFVNFDEHDKREGVDISGMLYVRKEQEQATIYVRIEDSYSRQTFTIAHELGHYILHCPLGASNTFVSLRGSRSVQETEANRFAAELLMPEQWIHNELYFFPSVSRLSKIFCVSEEAMRIRLESLGLYHVE